MPARARCLLCWGSDPLARAERDTGGGGEKGGEREAGVPAPRLFFRGEVPVTATRSRMRW